MTEDELKAMWRPAAELPPKEAREGLTIFAHFGSGWPKMLTWRPYGTGGSWTCTDGNGHIEPTWWMPPLPGPPVKELPPLVPCPSTWNGRKCSLLADHDGPHEAISIWRDAKEP